MTEVVTYFKPPRVEKRKHRMRSERQRDDKYLAQLRKLNCVCCGSYPTEAAHVRFTSGANGKRNTPMGQKPDDRWALPLCIACHRRQHSQGERTFWNEQSIDPILTCLKLHAARNDENLMRAIVRQAHS